MTTNTDIVNRALQSFGTRTTVTDAELSGNTSNEAIQANLILTKHRDTLLRMAPWDCALIYDNLTYITSVPGTQENSSPAAQLWARGIPAPPWAYEYLYPDDCLRACFMLPAAQSGWSGIPITTAVTGYAPTAWTGPAIRFKVAIDQFQTILSAAVAAAGTGYAVADRVTLPTYAAGEAPNGIPGVLRITSVNGSGGITGLAIVNQFEEDTVGSTGLYFTRPTNPVGVGSTTGSGTGATFNLTFASSVNKRVILTNQQYPVLAYVRRITDPNVMDPLFQDAWAYVVGASICYALTGDKSLANSCIAFANQKIKEARQADGNEGLTVNNPTPDFLRARGIAYDGTFMGPWSGYDWGNDWPLY